MAQVNTPTPFAATTTIPVEKTQADIRMLLQRHGADQFLLGEETGRAMIAFRIRGRHVRFNLPLPQEMDFSRTPSRNVVRTPAERRKAHEQACRTRWRQLFLIIKGRLEEAQSGVITLEEALMPYTILPSGQTVLEWIEPQVEEAYRTGEMPALLPGIDPGVLALASANNHRE